MYYFKPSWPAANAKPAKVHSKRTTTEQLEVFDKIVTW